MISSTPPHFNLITDPWLKVLNQDNQIQTVSLIDIVNQPKSFKQLAGETHFQDLVILRFLLAILLTVYTRYDANDQPYAWLTEYLDPQTMSLPNRLSKDDLADLKEAYEDNEDVLKLTWYQLYQVGHFTPLVNQYLNIYQHHFDLFDPKTPFYQLPADLYDQLAEHKPRDFRLATNKGQVPVSFFNRAVNQSGNSKSIFSFATTEQKNEIDLPQLVRWLITYQSYAGYADKGKTQYGKDHKLANDRGWLYQTTPVFLRGKNLFETLMLNLTLSSFDDDTSLTGRQQPVWEFTLPDYANRRLNQVRPDNLAELYTGWCRLMHIEWDHGQPTIFALGLPGFNDIENSFIEPMTRWVSRKRTPNQLTKLAPKSLSIDFLNHEHTNLWRNFGGYIPLYDTEHPAKIPNIINWVHDLQNVNGVSYLPKNQPLTLVLAGVASDGNAASRMLVREVYSVMQLDTEIAFDTKERRHTANYWPKRIETVIDETNELVKKDFYPFAKNAGVYRGLNDSKSSSPAQAYANAQIERFYDRLNEPFNNWLSHLTIHDDRDEKVQAWRQTLKQIAYQQAKILLEQSSPQQRRGKLNANGQPENIFTAYNTYCKKINTRLKNNPRSLQKEESTHDHVSA